MAEPALRLVGLSKAFGALVVSDKVDLDIRPGEIHALIGPNGAGKTTLLNRIAGTLPPDEGAVWLGGEDITTLAPHERARRGLARTFQITSVVPSLTALGNVELACQAHADTPLSLWRRAEGDAALEAPARAALAATGLADRAGALTASLAHGEKRALEVAMALAVEPMLVLLDEPLAGMGREESRAMIALLQGLRGRFAMLLVEHDMEAVFALADRVSVLVAGRVIATGSPEDVRADPAVRAAYLGDGEA